MKNLTNNVGNVLEEYTVEVRKELTTDGDEVYFAQYLQLEGCFGQGLNPEEAIKDLEDAAKEFLDSAINNSMPLVMQNTPKTSSDAFNFRFPSNIDNSKREHHIYAES